MLGAIATTFSGALFLSSYIPVAHADSIPVAHADSPTSSGREKERSIRLSEIQQHGRDAKRRWVMRGKRVYDIEDWIPNHPGTPRKPCVLNGNLH